MITVKNKIPSSATPTIDCPMPLSAFDPTGKPFYWRYNSGWNKQEGLLCYAEQYIVIHETPCYVTVAPARLAVSVWNGVAKVPESWVGEVDRIKQLSKLGWVGREIRRFKKDGLRPFARTNKNFALLDFRKRQEYRARMLRETLANVEVVVNGLDGLERSEAGGLDSLVDIAGDAYNVYALGDSEYSAHYVEL